MLQEKPGPVTWQEMFHRCCDGLREVIYQAFLPAVIVADIATSVSSLSFAMSSTTKTGVAGAEGKPPLSIFEWAWKIVEKEKIDLHHPEAQQKIWDYDLRNGCPMPSGSDLKEEDALRFRVIWYSWPSNSFGQFLRNPPNSTTTRSYTPFVSDENYLLARKVYDSSKHRWSGYLRDIANNGSLEYPGRSPMSTRSFLP
jgi:hypothetical protein